MNQYRKGILAIATVGLVAILFITIFSFSTMETPFIEEVNQSITDTYIEYNPETNKNETKTRTYNFGKDLTAIRITDVQDVNQIAEINYIGDTFVHPDKVMEKGNIIDLTKSHITLAKRGTFQLIILPPDKNSPTYEEDIISLEKFRKGDVWRLTIGIPPVFSACNIYASGKCVSTLGTISGYNFLDYTHSDDTITSKHSSTTKISYITLEFPTAMYAEDNFNPDESLVTIHYEASSNGLRGLHNCNVIGRYSIIVKGNESTVRMAFTGAIISIIVLSVLIFLSFLKKTTSFIPQLLIVLGIFLFSTAEISLHSVTIAPVFWTSLKLFAPAFTIASALFFMTKETKNKPLSYFVWIASSITLLLCFMIPYIQIELAKQVALVTAISMGIEALLVVGMVFYMLAKKRSMYQFITPVMVAIATLTHVFKKEVTLLFKNPAYWIMLLTTIVALIYCLKVMLDVEKQNRYLTDNLKTEVDIHTNELVKVIDDRNMLLQFVSHDLRKPLNFYAVTLNKIKANQLEGSNSEENIKLIDSLLKKGMEVDEAFRNIAEFSKINYLDENVEIVDLNSFLEKIYMTTSPDCEASGVVLTLDKLHDGTKAYAKINSLKSAIINVIFNALEHSECSEINMGIAQNNRVTTIYIHDNGKGIDPDIDIFKPYISENTGGNNGLGLYISKQGIESMNGTLDFDSTPGSTTFYINIPSHKE